jgi:hypothetical protein
MTEVEHPDFLGGPHFEPDLVFNGRLTRLCKGAKAPQQTAAQKKAERLQLKLLRQQLKQSAEGIEMPSIEIPEAPASPPPPPAAVSSDVADAEQEARRKASKRTNFGSGTLFAGETGGYLGGNKTLLG